MQMGIDMNDVRLDLSLTQTIQNRMDAVFRKMDAANKALLDDEKKAAEVAATIAEHRAAIEQAVNKEPRSFFIGQDMRRDIGVSQLYASECLATLMPKLKRNAQISALLDECKLMHVVKKEIDCNTPGADKRLRRLAAKADSNFRTLGLFAPLRPRLDRMAASLLSDIYPESTR